MANLPRGNIELIRAAGGLLWRNSDRGRQLLVIYRRRYDDWTLPKGKLDEGESWEDAALREVAEETGCKATIDGFAGIVSYVPHDQPKVVLFFNMSLEGHCIERHEASGGEVDDLRWITVPEALELLNYEGERGLLRDLRDSTETPLG